MNKLNIAARDRSHLHLAEVGKDEAVQHGAVVAHGLRPLVGYGMAFQVVGRQDRNRGRGARSLDIARRIAPTVHLGKQITGFVPRLFGRKRAVRTDD